jgi:hypothetical protein
MGFVGYVGQGISYSDTSKLVGTEEARQQEQ